MDITTLINTVVVPAGLTAIMFGLGLSLGLDDFRRVLRFPRAAAIGLVGQLLLLPAVALLLTFLIPVAPVVAVGLIILSACPGGVSSNAFIFAMGADVALSVTLTAITSMVTVFTIPLIAGLAMTLHMDAGSRLAELPVLALIGRLSQFTILPVVIGMIARAAAPAVAARALIYFRPASLMVLVGVVGASLYVSFDLMKINFLEAAPVALALNLSTMAIGYGLARLFRLSASQTVTIAFEIGVQNVGVAVLVALTLFANAALSVVPIIYGVIMFATAFAAMALWRRSAPA